VGGESLESDLLAECAVEELGVLLEVLGSLLQRGCNLLD
jgi:hypothetical protein